MIYFDSAATTFQKPVAVPNAVLRAMQTCASVGRGGHAAAMAAAETVYNCRLMASDLFDAEPEQVVFTMNATHALNAAIFSVLSPGARVVVSGFEHNAVTRPLHALHADVRTAGEKLFDEEDTLRAFARAIAEQPDAVVCTHVSNVFGYILPVEKIAAMCRERKIPFILDASQSAGTLPISLRQTGASFIAMPGHKGLYGPQGTGILLCADAGRPLMYGGTGSNSEDQAMPAFLPDRMEAGTHNVCGIAGLIEGMRFVRKQTAEAIFRHERELLAYAKRELSEQKNVRLFTGEGQAGVLSFRVEGEDCEEVAQALAQEGIAVRAGLHCAPLAHGSAGTADTGTVRLSFSAFNTPHEVRRFALLCKKLFPA
ncbi:MAG: aminotransferase class V-fold PLP-dependent enzyme [Oscillospiraceae bacterium]|nr:aminotransferase class V-fold PLP-dependent enzyme [Oscillospiraceae bacterium]